MPLWGWVAIGSGVLLLVAAGVAAVVLGWRAYERKALLRLLVRAEAVEAAASALLETFTRLANGSDSELEVFAEDPGSPERHALAEIHTRANLLADELDRMPLPRKLIPVAEALADAAYTICEQSGCVRDEDTDGVALERLLSIDLERVQSYTDKARQITTGACDVCGLDETAVYGGGLYL
ncbi:MAG TPA: hypothetical protein VLA05_08990 [Coriobacteriia bacterium]|nr:hypothetical protein [Coriobacteriia bacterium]